MARIFLFTLSFFILLPVVLFLFPLLILVLASMAIWSFAQPLIGVFSQIFAWIYGFLISLSGTLASISSMYLACLSWILACWFSILKYIFDLCKAAAEAILGRPAGLVLSFFDFPSLRGFASLVMDPLEAARQTRLALSSPLAELTDWRAVASTPSQARDRMKGLETELHAARHMLDTALGLLDDRDTFEAAWIAAAADLEEAYERIFELETELMRGSAVMDEAREIVRFARERPVLTGDSSGSGARRSRQDAFLSLVRKMGLLE